MEGKAVPQYSNLPLPKNQQWLPRLLSTYYVPGTIALCLLTYLIFTKPYEVGTIIFSVLENKAQRGLIIYPESHSSQKEQSWESKPGSLALMACALLEARNGV